MPAALLDARDRDPHVTPCGHEHGDVEDPILLCAYEFLAVVEQHVDRKRIRHGELRHRSGPVDLRYAQTERQGLVKCEVDSLRCTAWEQRRDDDAAVLCRVAELNIRIEHGATPFRFC